MKPCVLIPTYNNCTTIKGVINDALAAGYSVVVVNDGSTDSTAEILEEFGMRIILPGIQSHYQSLPAAE